MSQNLDSTSTRSRKKRGAPFKGDVSDNKEEGFKVQRQQELREFKTYFEKRSFLRNQHSDSKKKKKVFANHEDLEQVVREISVLDFKAIFGEKFLEFVSEQD